MSPETHRIATLALTTVALGIVIAVALDFLDRGYKPILPTPVELLCLDEAGRRITDGGGESLLNGCATLLAVEPGSGDPLQLAR